MYGMIYRPGHRAKTLEKEVARKQKEWGDDRGGLSVTRGA